MKFKDEGQKHVKKMEGFRAAIGMYQGSVLDYCLFFVVMYYEGHTR